MAANLNGSSSQLVRTAATSGLAHGLPTSIWGWAKPTANPAANKWMWTHSTDGSGRGWGIYLDANLNLALYKLSSEVSVVGTITTRLPLDEYSYIGVTIESNQVTFRRVDESDLGTVIKEVIGDANAVTSTLADSDILMGVHIGGSLERFTGGLARWRECNAAISDAQFLEGLTGAPTGLTVLGHWPLVANPNDVTANANHLTDTDISWDSYDPFTDFGGGGAPPSVMRFVGPRVIGGR